MRDGNQVMDHPRREDSPASAGLTLSAGRAILIVLTRLRTSSILILSTAAVFAMVLPAFVLAQSRPAADSAMADSTQGRLDGLRDGQSGTEGSLWQHGTCCLTLPTSCLGAYLVAPQGVSRPDKLALGSALGGAAGLIPAMYASELTPAVPASRVAGRSREYVAAYSEAFRESRRRYRIAKAVYGWETAIGLVGISIGAALLLDW